MDGCVGYTPDNGTMSDLATLQDTAQTYLSSVPRSTRREEGQVYTPSHLVEFILDLGEYLSDSSLEERRVLDPACGAGAFLVAVVSRLASSLETQGHDLKTTVGRSRFLASIERMVWGVDKDPHACGLAREAVRLQARGICGRDVPAGFFDANILEGDFLLGDMGSLRQQGFDLIVGNPPYVATTRLSDRQKDQLRARFISANGRLDLYALFFERSLKLLCEGGRLAFITPNKYLASESSRWLRKLIVSQASLRKLANFRSHRVFADAATVPCVTVLERSAGATSFELLECSVAPGGQGPVSVLKKQRMNHPRGGARPWLMAEPRLLALGKKIQDGHPTLGHRTCRISAGIATGRDRIFVLEPGAGVELEPELRRPAVRGKDISPYRIRDSGLEVIIPYLSSGNGRPTLVDLDDFPRTRAYLEKSRGELEKRHCVRKWKKAWFDIHDPWTLDITGLTKVLVPDVAQGNRFALDTGKFCPLHSAYYILPEGVEPEFLTAVLNSTPIEYLVRLLAPVVKDGFSRYRRQFLITLPIPETTSAIQAEITRASGAEDLAKADELCCRLFGLSRQDLKTMREFLERALSVHGGSVVPDL